MFKKAICILMMCMVLFQTVSTNFVVAFSNSEQLGTIQKLEEELTSGEQAGAIQTLTEEIPGFYENQDFLKDSSTEVVITGVLNPEKKTVSWGCISLAELQPSLPPQVCVELSNGQSMLMNVEWKDENGYFKQYMFSSTLQGDIVLTNGITNPSGIRAGIDIKRGDFTTENGYSDPDYQCIKDLLRSFLSYDEDGEKLPNPDIPSIDDANHFTWITKLTGGLPTKYLQSINLDGLKKYDDQGQFLIENLSELTIFSYKDGNMGTIWIRDCEKLVNFDCRNSGLYSLIIEDKNTCGSLSYINCSNNNLRICTIPGINDVPQNCEYIYSPQKSKSDSTSHLDLENYFYLDIINLTEPNLENGYYFPVKEKRTERGNPFNYYNSPYTLKWKDEMGNEIAYRRVLTTESEDESEEFAFIKASGNEGKRIHYEIDREDLPGVVEIGTDILLPIYGQQVLSATFSDEEDPTYNQWSEIDYSLHKIFVNVDYGVDYTKINYTFKLAEGSTLDISLSGTIDLSKAVEFYVSDGNNQNQRWTVSRSNTSSSAEITSLGFEGITGVNPTIDPASGEIRVSLPISSDAVKTLIPEFELSQGATISPMSGEAIDFTRPVSFTVTAEDGTIKTWKVFVRYDGAECTCKITDLGLKQTDIGASSGVGAWGDLRELTGSFPDVLVTKDDCPIEGHSIQVPTFTYKIGSTNEVGAIIRNDKIVYNNPGEVSVVVTATLNGYSMSKEFMLNFHHYNNFKLSSSEIEVPLPGDDITIRWNDDNINSFTEYKVYYSRDLTYGQPKKEIATVVGKNELTLPWIYGEGYVTIVTSEWMSYICCSAKVNIRPLKVMTDVSLTKTYDGKPGGFNSKDYEIGYKFYGADYEEYKDRIKLYVKVDIQGEGGTSVEIPETKYTVTDSKIIIHKEAFPEIDLSKGCPWFTLHIGIGRADGGVTEKTYTEGDITYVRGLKSFYEFQIFPAYEVPSIIDYNGNVLDADHPLLLGPGFMDMSKLTIEDLKKGTDNPIKYASSLDFKYNDGKVNPIGAGWKYTISDPSVAEFYFGSVYDMDGTEYKVPDGIVAKKDGECVVNFENSYIGKVISFPVKVSLEEDKLVWFRLLDKRGVPYVNSTFDILNSAVPKDGKVTYYTKTGEKKTANADDNGYVVIYEPEGITGEVEARASHWQTNEGYIYGKKTLDLSTEFKTNDTFRGGVLRYGALFQYVYLYDYSFYQKMNFELMPATSLGTKPGWQLGYTNTFNEFAMERIRAAVYIQDKNGKLVHASNGQTKYYAPVPPKGYSKEVRLNEEAEQAMQDDDTKIIVELTPITSDENLTYRIKGYTCKTEQLYPHYISTDSEPRISEDGNYLEFFANEKDFPSMDTSNIPHNYYYMDIEVEDSLQRTVMVKAMICTSSEVYNMYYKTKTAVRSGKSYKLDLNGTFKGPIIQSTLFERTVAELRKEGSGLNGDYIKIPVSFVKSNGEEYSITSVTITDERGNISDASTRTSPLAITSENPTVIKAYIKSSDTDVTETVEAYKKDVKFDDSIHEVESYFLGSGENQMKYKWYVSTLKIDSNVLPPTDYFKPFYKILKRDGTTLAVTPRFEAANFNGMDPNPNPPTSLPFTGNISSGVFDSNMLGKNMAVNFSLPKSFGVKVEYEFTEGTGEGTFRMLVGNSMLSKENITGQAFQDSYADAMNKIRYGAMRGSKGTKISGDFTVAGYINGIVRFVDGKYKLIATGGGIIANAGFDFKYCQNTFIAFIPVYYGIDIGASLSLTASIDAFNDDDDKAIAGDYDIAYKAIVEIAGYIKISGGIGFDFSVIAAKIGAFGQLDLSYKLGILYANGDASIGGKFELKGTIGLEMELKFLVFSKRYVLCDAGFTYTYSHGDLSVFGEDSSQKSMVAPQSPEEAERKVMKAMAVVPLSDYNPNGTPIGEYVLLDTGYQNEERSYLENPQIMASDNELRLMSLDKSSNSTQNNILQNAYPYSYPQISKDNQIAVMLSDMGSYDVNETSVISLKNVEGIWTSQGKIDPAEDTPSSNFSYDGDKSFGIAAWENIKVTYSSDMDEEAVSEVANQTEIKAGMYNGSNWSTVSITDNAIPDLGPKVVANNDKGALLWLRSRHGFGDTDPMISQSPSELILKKFTNGNWSDEINLNIPEGQTVKSYDVAIMSDETIMVVYSYEKPGATGGDSLSREIARILVAPSGVVLENKNITSDTLTDTNPKIVAKKLMIEGNEIESFYLAWYNEKPNVDADGKIVVTKDILLKAYDKENNEANMPESVYVTRDESDPEVSENFIFIKSESSDPKSFGISWVMPYQRGEASKDYGIIAKVFTINDNNIALSAPLQILKLDEENSIIDTQSSNIQIDNGSATINTVLSKTVYTESHDLDDVLTMAQTDICSSLFALNESIGIEYVDFDKNMIYPNKDTQIKFGIRNEGIKEIKSFHIESNDGQTFDISDPLIANRIKELSVSYKNGETIKSPIFTITPCYMDDSVGETVSSQVNLGLCDLEIVDVKKTNAGENGVYTFNISVRNKSNYKMEPNNIALDLGIFEDRQYTVRANIEELVNNESMTDEDLDQEVVTYSYSYNVASNDYDKNGLKLLYVSIAAKDADGNILEELFCDNNDAVLDFTDPEVLHKEPLSVELNIEKSNENPGGTVKASITNLLDTNKRVRLILISKDENKNVLESHAIEVDLEGSATTQTLSMTEFSKLNDISYQVVDMNKIGFVVQSQDGMDGNNSRILVTAYGGSGSYEYSKDNGLTWQQNNVFENLSNRVYPICVRDAANTELISEVSGVIAVLANQTFNIETISENGTIEKNPNKEIYVAGETITLTAVPNKGYNFDGWYEGEIKIASLSQYTTTATRDMCITARFSPMSKGLLEVTVAGRGGVQLNDEIINLPENYKYLFTMDTEIRLTAIADPEWSFFYWEDVKSGSLISTNPVYNCMVGGGQNIKAVFHKLPDSSITGFNVIFKDVSMKILQSTMVMKNITAVPPSDPVLVGYRFKGWDQDFSNVTSDMIIKPIFERLEDTYTVTVAGGKLTTGSTTGEYQFDMPVRVVADTAPSGYRFSHWEQDGVKISIEPSYTLYMPRRTTAIVAIFVEDNIVLNKTPFITLSDDVIVDPVNHTMMFTANRTVPSGFTLVESGVLLLKYSASLTEELTVDTENVIRGRIKNDSTDQFYIRKSNIADGDTWYARGYLIYMDSYSNIFTVYSNNTASKRMGGEI